MPQYHLDRKFKCTFGSRYTNSLFVTVMLPTGPRWVLSAAGRQNDKVGAVFIATFVTGEDIEEIELKFMARFMAKASWPSFSQI